MTCPTVCAFLDASVLYPATLRNLFMRLTLAGLFQARWSAGVHEEWIRSVLRDRPEITRAQLERTRELMDLHADDAIVTGYESLVEGLTLPDPDDRHVLAAAIAGGASVIVTRNLKDFPAEILDAHDIEAQHPDEFVRRLIDLAPAAIVEAIRDQQAALKNPPVSMEELMGIFERLDLKETVAGLGDLTDRGA
jgi:predicted nucleic acid-binding protein